MVGWGISGVRVMGRVVTKDGVVRTALGTYVSVAGSQDVLVDTNGTACCCEQPGCCTSCRKYTPNGSCGAGCVDRDSGCCHTRAPSSGDILTGGYWYANAAEGPNFWTIEITQLADAPLGSADTLWSFNATVRERCKFNNVITDTTSTIAVTLQPGYTFSRNDNTPVCYCRHHNLPTFTGTGCFTTKWGALRLVAPPGGTYGTDQFSMAPDCWSENLSGTSLDRRSTATWTLQFFWIVNKCAQRCTGDCTTCP